MLIAIIAIDANYLVKHCLVWIFPGHLTRHMSLAVAGAADKGVKMLNQHLLCTNRGRTGSQSGQTLKLRMSSKSGQAQSQDKLKVRTSSESGQAQKQFNFSKLGQALIQDKLSKLG